MNKICVGIISWFPDNPYRDERIRRCKNLIEKCKELFDCPILIITQNWRQEIHDSQLICYDYPKLGITNARKKLWNLFRTGEYDWILLLDDDCELTGSRKDGKRLFSFLRGHNDGYIIGRENEFKLFAASKKIAQAIEIPDLDVEIGTGIEDYAFFRLLHTKFPSKRLVYDWGKLSDVSRWQGDVTSSWNRKNLPELFKKTNEYLTKTQSR